MKKSIIVLMVLLFALPCFCFAEVSNVTLKWEYEDIGSITGYKLYRSKESGVYNFELPVHVISDPSIKTITDYHLKDGVYYWVITAYYNYVPAEGLDPVYFESEPSNQVKATLKTVKPNSPEKLKAYIIDIVLEQ